jgi:hypothetical protein
MIIVLLVVIGVFVVSALGLCVEMHRREEALLGATAILLMMIAGVLGTIHAALAAE